MQSQQFKNQVETIRQTFSYIHLFKGQTFVFKIADALITHDLFPLLIKDLVLLQKAGIRIIIVPGARYRINEVLNAFNIKCKTHAGIRISTAESIPFIKMAASDVSNRIMTLLAESGTHAVVGNWVKARGIGVRDGIDFQNSGLVEKIQVDIIRNTLEQGLVPLFPNIGWSAKGKPYNISSDDLAFSLAAALKATKLFFVTNNGGISGKKFTLPKDVSVGEDGLVNQMTAEQAGSFVELNAQTRQTEILEMVNLGYKACAAGVQRVHIVDGRVEGMILKEIFTNQGLGSMIYANQFENIRLMEFSDIPDVLRIMQPSIDEGILIPRTAADLEQKRLDYIVYEVDETIHGCGALHSYNDTTAEIAGIAVDDSFGNNSIGKKIVEALIAKARHLKLKQVFVLTTHTADWFELLGFTPGILSDLPESKRQKFNIERNSRILIYRLTRQRSKRRIGVE